MTTFIARTPTDLLAVVPPALGFHPEQSVVLLTFGHHPELTSGFHVRLDLPVGDEARAEVTAMLRDLVVRKGVGQAAVVLYTDDPGAATAFCDVLVPALVGVGTEIVDLIRVHDGRYYPVGEDDPGTPYDLDGHPLTIEHADSGREIQSSRAALAATLLGRASADTVEVRAAADRAADQLLTAGARAAAETSGRRPSLVRALSDELAVQGRWLQERIRSALGAPDELSATDAGRIVVLVALEVLREVAWAEIDRAGSLAHLNLWRSLVRRAPAELRSGPAALLAFAAWLDGQGALAWCALELCFADSPDDPLGQYVATLLESATPPTVWTPILESELQVFG